MPLSRYDRYFSQKGGAAKALAAMTKQYGEQKGRSVFFAMVNKRRKSHRGGNGLSKAMHGDRPRSKAA